MKAWVALLINLSGKIGYIKRKHIREKWVLSARTTKLNWELQVLGQIHHLFLALTLKRKWLSSHMKDPSYLPIILEIKKILSHIYKTKISHSPLLKQIWHISTSKNRLSWCLFLKFLHNITCHHIGLRDWALMNL